MALVDAVLQALFGIKAEVSARVEGWFPGFNIVAVRDEDERALVELGFQGVYVGGGLGAACDGVLCGALGFHDGEGFAVIVRDYL